MDTEQRLNQLSRDGKIYWYRIEGAFVSIASKSNEGLIEPIEFAINSDALEQFLQKNEASK